MAKNKARPKNPAKTIFECPACGSKNLLRMEVDVLCVECDWMSVEMYVESGGMDNIFAAYVEHFHGDLLEESQSTQDAAPICAAITINKEPISA